MALINCPECNQQISDQATACPHCGLPLKKASTPINQNTTPLPAAWTNQQSALAPSPTIDQPKKQSKHYGCGTLIIGLFALFAFATFWNTVHNSSSTQQSTSSAPALTRPSAALPLSKTPATPIAIEHPKQTIDTQWDYKSDTDSMSGKEAHDASVISTNSFQFDFPYTGEQHATLEIRHHPRYGNDIIFHIEKGQILCSSITDDCPIRVRFDDEPAKTYQGNEPADHSSETVFIPGYGAFTAKMQKAKIVRIEANIFQNGSLVAEFNVKGFDPSKLK